MICSFFGHTDAPENIKNALKNHIVQMIEKNIFSFYTGNNGKFDFMVQSVLEDLSLQYPQITYSIVLSHIGERAISGNQNRTVFPDGLELVPPRFAISKRNEWLIQHSDIVLTYLKYHSSNCAKWVEKAKRKKLKVINIAE